MTMTIIYHRVMYKVLQEVWYWWHCTSRNWFDKLGEPVYWSSDEPRPWWHMCCNGNAGGWRTKLCDCLEDYPTGWRRHQDVLDQHLYEEIKGDA